MKIKVIVLFIAIMLSSIFCLACSPPTISADELYTLFCEHESYADNEFKGKVLIVGGEIGSTGRTDKGEAYVILLSDWVWVHPLTGYEIPLGVECRFNEEQESALASVRVGDIVSIKGKCLRLSRNILNVQGNVIVENCLLVE